jgi:predicted aconitase with swiveling domain
MASRSAAVFMARPIVVGEASGSAVVLEHGISFAMAFDVESGRVSDVHSTATGQLLSGRILVMPSGRGSSSASTSFAEAIRLGTAPAGLVLTQPDEILAIGAMVARTLYGKTCPIVVAEPSDHAMIRTGTHVSISADGRVDVVSV